MERDKKFILEALLEIQENCKNGAAYNICGAMCRKGYDLDMCRYHLDLMDDAGYLKGTYKMMGANVIVTGLTNLGHDYIEKANGDETVKAYTKTTNINIYGNVNNSDLSTNKNGDFNNNNEGSKNGFDTNENERKNRRTQILVAIIGALAVVVGAIITAFLNNS